MSYNLTPLALPSTTTVAIPGSKSYTNRALLLAAMTPGTTTISNPLISDDTKAMIDCLKTLGIDTAQTETSIKIAGDIRQITNQEYTLNAGLSGTTIRFLLALSCVIPGTQIITGEHGLLLRPIGDLVDALRAAGANITYLDKEGFPPLHVSSSRLTATEIHVSGKVSSQYLSALLMVAPLTQCDTVIVHGELISKPYATMTLDTMRQFGVTVTENDGQYKIPKDQQYTAANYQVEGDVSSASYFAAIATLTGSAITLTNINPQSAQADMDFIRMLEIMGSTLAYGEDSITITGNGRTIQPAQIDMETCPDQAMTMAVLLAFANGVSTISGVRSLRVKETERVAALEKELAKMGIKTSSTNDTLTIHGGNPQPATIDTYGDHRMAMAFAVAGSKLPGMRINNPEVVSKTFPDFWENLKEIGVGVQESRSNIALIGMRGSGKTTTAKLLGEKLNREVIEIDEIIAKRVGMNIPELIAKEGWEAFRDHEAIVTAEASQKTNAIISTGGGVVLRPENVAALKRSSSIVCLQANTSILERRIGNSNNRPALTAQQNLAAELEQVASERKKLYESAADFMIETNNQTPEQVTEKIITLLKEQQK